MFAKCNLIWDGLQQKRRPPFLPSILSLPQSPFVVHFLFPMFSLSPRFSLHSVLCSQSSAAYRVVLCSQSPAISGQEQSPPPPRLVILRRTISLSLWDIRQLSWYAQATTQPATVEPISRLYPVYLPQTLLGSREEAGSKNFPSLRWLKERRSEVWCFHGHFYKVAGGGVGPAGYATRELVIQRFIFSGHKKGNFCLAE